MVSTKRRRGIGLRRWLVSAMKHYAKREGVSAHTTIVNRILRGEMHPLPDYERYKEGGDETKQDVSMPEELWLAVKDYSHRRGKGESSGKIATRILVGLLEPIPLISIEEGKRQARVREAERLAKGYEPILPKKKVKKKAKKKSNGSAKKNWIHGCDPSQEEVILQEREELDKKKANARPLSQGVPVEKKVSEKKINSDDDSYGGIFNF